MAGIRDIVTVTQEQLNKIIADGKFIVRVGATINPEKRADDYERDGYTGVMYVAFTKNMMKAGDKLLRNGYGIYNRQGLSNAPEAPGYIYAIKGRKMA